MPCIRGHLARSAANIPPRLPISPLGQCVRSVAFHIRLEKLECRHLCIIALWNIKFYYNSLLGEDVPVRLSNVG